MGRNKGNGSTLRDTYTSARPFLSSRTGSCLTILFQMYDSHRKSIVSKLFDRLNAPTEDLQEFPNKPSELAVNCHLVYFQISK